MEGRSSHTQRPIRPFVILLRLELKTCRWGQHYYAQHPSREKLATALPDFRAENWQTAAGNVHANVVFFLRSLFSS